MFGKFENIQETLKNVIVEHGEEILLDTYKLSAVLSDFASDEKKARMLLMLALDEGIGKYYVDLLPDAPKQHVIDQTAETLKGTFTADCIKDVTMLLFYVLEWDVNIVEKYFADYQEQALRTEQTNLLIEKIGAAESNLDNTIRRCSHSCDARYYTERETKELLKHIEKLEKDIELLERNVRVLENCYTRITQRFEESTKQFGTDMEQVKKNAKQAKDLLWFIVLAPLCFFVFFLFVDSIF